jgi:prophage regulatory protein
MRLKLPTKFGGPIAIDEVTATDSGTLNPLASGTSAMPFDETSTEQFLTVDQVASRHNTSTDSIYRWKREGDFPKAVRLGKGTTRWRLSDLVAHEATLQCSFIIRLGPIRGLSSAG